MPTTFNTTFRTIRTRLLMLLAVGALGLGVSLAGAGAAHAEPKGGPGAGSSTAYCPVIIDGKWTYVPEGSRVGILYCGHDGNWHIGWLVDAVAHGGPAGQGTKPVISVQSTRNVLLPDAQ